MTTESLAPKESPKYRERLIAELNSWSEKGAAPRKKLREYVDSYMHLHKEEDRKLVNGVDVQTRIWLRRMEADDRLEEMCEDVSTQMKFPLNAKPNQFQLGDLILKIEWPFPNRVELHDPIRGYAIRRIVKASSCRSRACTNRLLGINRSKFHGIPRRVV